MNEDFKKWLCELTGENVKWANYEPSLEILIKAMWAINRENQLELQKCIKNDNYKPKRQWRIVIDEDHIHFNEWPLKIPMVGEDYYFKDYNNSEQATLEAALQYIYNNKG